MIDVIVAAILVFGFLAGILWMCEDLWRKTYRRQDLELSHWHQPHAHFYDSDGWRLEDNDSFLIFCECGEPMAVQKARGK